MEPRRRRRRGLFNSGRHTRTREAALAKSSPLRCKIHVFFLSHLFEVLHKYVRHVRGATLLEPASWQPGGRVGFHISFCKRLTNKCAGFCFFLFVFKEVTRATLKPGGQICSTPTSFFFCVFFPVALHCVKGNH